MDSKTIVETYKRYLNTFKDKDSDLFDNYGRITDFIDTKCESEELRSLLYQHCIGKNLKEIRKRNIKIKDYSTDGWSTVVTSNGYQLLKNIRTAEREGDYEAYKLNLYSFFKLADNQKPHLQLYLYLCYADRIGESLFAVPMEEIEEVANEQSEEEIASPSKAQQ